MNDSSLMSIAQLKEFVKVAEGIRFAASSRAERYRWVDEVLMRFRYRRLRKKEKSIVKRYVMKMTGYSDAQLTRLITKKRTIGKIIPSSRRRHSFPRIYTAEDVAMLAETDRAHSCLSGPATKRIFERECEKFGKQSFRRLKDISVSHLYNLRGTRQYRSRAQFFTKTRSVNIPIGERRKPRPYGQPGFLRVDTVHQGDSEHEKGVYHINIVDEVTQWELVGAVEKISERYLAPLLETLINQFPFRIVGFHSDNGSEYINQIVARLLNTLIIRQTKSRARHCNDNALVEGKNGAVIRKHMGYAHIPQSFASAINHWYQNFFNVYLNYHRPSGFATVTTDARGKQKKIYDTYLTPYEKLRSLQKAASYFREGVTGDILDTIAHAMSDNGCASLMQKEKQKLFQNLGR